MAYVELLYFDLFAGGSGGTRAGGVVVGRESGGVDENVERSEREVVAFEGEEAGGGSIVFLCGY